MDEENKPLVDSEAGKPQGATLKVDKDVQRKSRIAKLKGLVDQFKNRRNGNRLSVSEGSVSTRDSDTKAVESMNPQGENQLQESMVLSQDESVIEVPQSEQNSEEVTDTEPIKTETIEGICDVMKGLPRLEDASAYNIPYRVARRSHMDGVFDDETGLYVEASYQIGDKMSWLRAAPGLSIILSTPQLIDSETTTTSLDKMGEALRKIYGDSDELERLLPGIGYKVGEEGQPDRIKFEFECNDGEEVLSQFNQVFGEQRPGINRYASQRQVLETGGQFIKGIVERAAQKQIEESEENKQQTQQVIDKVKDEASANDESKVYQYAYHATHRSNLPDISKDGLQPSGEDSKEPGTIFFTGWDSATAYHPKGGEGVLYRFHVVDMPEIANEWHFDNEEGLTGIGHSIATDKPIPSERLDFSLDQGETWMPAVPRKTIGPDG